MSGLGLLAIGLLAIPGVLLVGYWTRSSDRVQRFNSSTASAIGTAVIGAMISLTGVLTHSPVLSIGGVVVIGLGAVSYFRRT
jgi:hypothetical protein